MIKLINLRTSFYWVAIGACAFLWLAPEIQGLAATYAPAMVAPLSILNNARVVALIIAGVASLFLFQCVWRTVWRLPVIGPFLSERLFPDLNGDWEIEIRSNWPIISAMANAAKDKQAERLDAFGDPARLPSFVVSKFRGKINQRWYGSTLTIDSNESTPLRTSRTVSFDFLRATDDQPKRVAWFFRQENREVTASDEDNFLGSALLEVTNSVQLDGKYWNNRSWRRGLNAAGEITMRRLKN